ncbi:MULTISPECIES: EamA family transporter [Ralstonia solanacearum species complex]|uniref:GntR family transcriptional regulator n=2 Tax=Ralstonia solanacearum species complex TaxID=3116862 RepID=A0A0S4UFW0_RALSL|nr:EamA family transporter [Ralstonia pseudosolanacearum]APC66453.1 GntR family transcriptional regulator [Ralstonia solanacearum OE1-1]AUS45157.1 GntR family transcriptional regulator [Ralstonia solanacearum]API77373.1 GntR family transcriptional regulator [Ralstonia pseudosolanacearum]ASL76582.1 GntR family transcriptional regulator [Ralstonia pseudosolanacearum]AST89548.1 GntR family transcriptional regulator [Ralstonia pseudosolanacearum]
MTPFIALCLLITYVVWGTTYLAIRFALTDLPPFLMMGSRFLAAALLLTPIVLLRQRERVSPRQLRNCMLVGAFLLVGGMGMTAVAQQTISSGATTVMIASMPLFSTLWMLLAGGRLRAYEVAAIALGSIGIAVLFRGAEFQASTGGVLALTTAIASWSFGSQLSKHLDMPKGLTAFVLEMAFGGVALTLLSLATGEHWPRQIGLHAALAWGYQVTFGSAIAFTAYMALVQRVSTVMATSYVYVNPPIALLMGAWLADEQVAPQTLGATAIILSAVVVLTAGATRAARRAAPA